LSVLYIPQSKIKDFCQPPLGKGAFDANLKQIDKLGFYEQKRHAWKMRVFLCLTYVRREHIIS